MPQAQLMNTVSSEVDIANIALDMIKEAPIQQMDDNRAAARWMSRNFYPYRDFVLSTHPWRFALKRASLAADSTAPEFGWDNRYQLPSDCLRPLAPRFQGALDGRLIPHEVEAGFVLTNAPAPLLLRYISRTENISQYSNTPLFVEAFAAKLAAGIAHWMTGKQGMAERAEVIFREALEAARFMESNQGTPAQQYANAYDDARFEYTKSNTRDFGSSAANN